MSEPTVSRSVQIQASPERVFALVTDLAVLADLAAETEAMSWRKGSSVTPGAVFEGSNRNGRRAWKTQCTITDVVPGATFAFEVTNAVPPAKVARWQYDIVASGTGSSVTESTWDRRPGWLRLIAGLVTGVQDRTAASAEHIETTLGRLKQRAEAD